MTEGAPTDPQTLATALRDLSVAANLFEGNPNDRNRQRLLYTQEYIEILLDQFTASESDIYPAYLPGCEPFLAR